MVVPKSKSSKIDVKTKLLIVAKVNTENIAVMAVSITCLDLDLTNDEI